MAQFMGAIGRYPDTTEHAIMILEVLAHLSSEFEANMLRPKFGPAFTNSNTNPGPGRANILLARSPRTSRGCWRRASRILGAAEDQYYTLELSLTPAQLPIFLAQLSCREDVSDNHLQSLI